MKNTLLTFGLLGLTAALLSSFAFTQKSGEVQEPQKTRHIIMTKIENGKKMKLDTVLLGDGIFVWDGDTVNLVEHHRMFDPSGFNRMPRVDNGKDHRLSMDDGDGIPKPPAPPVPPFSHMKVMKMQRHRKIIDLNDPNIISYKKKDMSGDREKIEIIRKKSGDIEDLTFNFPAADELMAPEPPEAPAFNWESDGDSLQMRINGNEENVKGEKVKKIVVEVESEENK